MKRKVVMGIDLAGKSKNPTGLATLATPMVETRILYSGTEILNYIKSKEPILVAVDAPFALPKSGIIGKADRGMVKRGYRVFPPTLKAMRTLTLRAIALNRIIEGDGFKIIEVHPTSTRKALNMPTKDWNKIQTILKATGLKGDLQAQTLTPHEIDAVTSALTAHLHLQNQTETFGDYEEGSIIVPKKQEWRAMKI